MKSSATHSAHGLATQLLQAGRSADPVRYDVDAGLYRHRALVQLGAPIADWAAEPAKSAAKILASTGGKAVIGSLLAAAVTASAWAYSAAREASSAPPSASQEAVAARSMGAGPAGARETDAVARAQTPGSVTALDALERVPVEDSAAVASAASGRPRPHSEVLKPKSSSSAEVVLAEAPEKVAVPSSAPAPAPAGSAPGGPEVSEEVSEVATAERLLASNPAQALALARAGDARFPRGFLGQERRYIEVMALFQMGSTSQAQQDARRFLKIYPVGPYAQRVRARLGEGNDE